MISDAQLLNRQAMPLEVKIQFTKDRISQFYRKLNGNVYVSRSGKDSLVVAHIAQSLFPDIKQVFIDTGLEFPSIRECAKKDDAIILKPKIPFNTIIKKYGFPVISKENAEYIYQIRNSKSQNLINKRLYGDSKGRFKLPKKWRYLIDAPFKISHLCCNYLKKQPAISFEKKINMYPILGTMACESSMRKSAYLQTGCNSFNSKRPMSKPISFWKEKDIWEYIHINKLEYPKVYDMGYSRTGCMFCMFGVHLEPSDLFRKNRFQKLKETHPKEYNYCINELKIGKVLEYINIPY